MQKHLFITGVVIKVIFWNPFVNLAIENTRNSPIALLIAKTFVSLIWKKIHKTAIMALYNCQKRQYGTHNQEAHSLQWIYQTN